MSSVLHPVGPEPGERYWVRRLAVLVGIVVALVIIIALVVNATSAGSAVQAEPAVPPPATVPVATPTETPTATPTPTPSSSAGATPSRRASESPSATTTATAKPSASTSGTPTAKSSTPAKTPTAKAKTPVTACVASGLRATLTGDRTPQAGHSTTLSLSLINGSGQPCYLEVNRGNFAVTVVSGRDRIWSTKDCASTVPSMIRKLAPEQAAGWKVVWNGQRSANGCHNRPQKPRPGTYVATATFDGAEPVRLRMVLQG